MKIFIKADHHSPHKNIIEYCKRSFKTVEEMDKAMIEKIQENIRIKTEYPIHYERIKEGKVKSIYSEVLKNE